MAVRAEPKRISKYSKARGREKIRLAAERASRGNYFQMNFAFGSVNRILFSLKPARKIASIRYDFAYGRLDFEFFDTSGKAGDM